MSVAVVTLLGIEMTHFSLLEVDFSTVNVAP